VNLKHLLAEEKKKGIFAVKRLPCQFGCCYNCRSRKKRPAENFLHCYSMILLSPVSDYITFYEYFKVGVIFLTRQSGFIIYEEFL